MADENKEAQQEDDVVADDNGSDKSKDSKRKTIKELEQDLNNSANELKALVLSVKDEFSKRFEDLDAKIQSANTDELRTLISNVRDDFSANVEVLEAKLQSANYDRQVRDLNQEIKELFGKIHYLESSSEAHKIQADVVELERQLDTVAEGLVCVLLTQCRGIGEMGWEKVLKRYWKTTGGVVFPEDKTALKAAIDENRKLNIIRTFLDFSFDTPTK